MDDYVITAKDLTKVYKMGEVEVHALRGLSMQIRARRRWSPSWDLPARENPR